MKITTTLALAVGLAALAGCQQAEENAADNMDANLEMPADNFDTMDANLANDTMDANLGNDTNAADNTTTNNTAGNAY